MCDTTVDAERIVSLAPSITELLFALELGDHVVGVTEWCRWPKAAADLPRVGGVVDPNIEVIASLKPTLVVVEEANADVAAALERLGLMILEVDHRDTAGILASVTRVGEACGMQAEAATLRGDLEARLSAVAAATDPSTEPVIMVIVGRDVASGELRDVYAAAGGTFLGELLEAAGGRNALTGRAIRYPTVGREALLRLHLDHVFELAPELDGDPEAVADLRRAWADVGVPESRVHVLTDDAPLIPGPRFVETVERFAALLAEARQ